MVVVLQAWGRDRHGGAGGRCVAKERQRRAVVGRPQPRVSFLPCRSGQRSGRKRRGEVEPGRMQGFGEGRRGFNWPLFLTIQAYCNQQ